MGIILPLIFAFISRGKVFFAAVGSFTIITKTTHRVGRKYTRLTELEEGKIALAGPLASIAFAIVLKFLSSILSVDLSVAITINLSIAAFNMIPLPKLDGGRIFFGNKGMYLFNLIFILICVFLLKVMGTFLTVGLSMIFAALITLNYIIIRYKS